MKQAFLWALSILSKLLDQGRSQTRQAKTFATREEVTFTYEVGDTVTLNYAVPEPIVAKVIKRAPRRSWKKWQAWYKVEYRWKNRKDWPLEKKWLTAGSFKKT